MSDSFAKILVVYHKKTPLYKSDVLVPIHAGRVIAKEKSKDGIISNKDLDWMISNMIGDDTGDNISKENRFLNEMTAIYWAWKNYDKLGNPEYIGLYHYRRFLGLNNIISSSNVKHVCSLYKNEKIKSILSSNDIITSSNEEDRTILEKWTNHSVPGVNLKNLNICLDYVKKDNPRIGQEMEKFLKNKSKFLCNMFIMKKEHFFAYCEWIFPIIFYLKNTLEIDYKSENPNAIRLVGYFGEMLTSAYISYMESQKLEFKKVPMCTIKEAKSIAQKIRYANGVKEVYVGNIKVIKYKSKSAE